MGIVLSFTADTKQPYMQPSQSPPATRPSSLIGRNEYSPEIDALWHPIRLSVPARWWCRRKTLRRGHRQCHRCRGRFRRGNHKGRHEAVIPIGRCIEIAVGNEIHIRIITHCPTIWAGRRKGQQQAEARHERRQKDVKFFIMGVPESRRFATLDKAAAAQHFCASVHRRFVDHLVAGPRREGIE